MLLPALLLAIRIAPESPEVQFKQPQLATDGRTIGVAFGSSEGVYFARSIDGGKSFSKPVLVSNAGKVMLGMHRGPRIAMVPGAIVISAIMRGKANDAKTASAGAPNQEGHAGHHAGHHGPPPGGDGDLISWHSSDGGETWSNGVKVNDVPASAREGLHAMAAGGGVLFSTWLDLRDKGTRLYGSISRDGGKTWSKNMLVYESPSGTICQCCHPSVAMDTSGNITVMLRNSLEGSRDMYVVRSTDRGQTFSAGQKLGERTWVLNACPMDGGGVAISDKGEVVSVWRREKEIFTTTGSGPEKVIGTGKDPSIAIGKAGTYIAWTSVPGIHALTPGKGDPVVLAAEGAYPQLLPLPNGLMLATWESKGTLAFEVLK
jgi:hypothetical protein